MTRTRNLFVATALAVATLAAPAIAANNVTDKAKPSQIKRTATNHHHHVNMRTRENEASIPRGGTNANANFSNANASAARPVESMATQYGAAYSRIGNGSGPVCKPGEMVQEMDGQMHPCQ